MSWSTPWSRCAVTKLKLQNLSPWKSWWRSFASRGRRREMVNQVRQRRALVAREIPSFECSCAVDASSCLSNGDLGDSFDASIDVSRASRDITVSNPSRVFAQIPVNERDLSLWHAPQNSFLHSERYTINVKFTIELADVVE